MKSPPDDNEEAYTRANVGFSRSTDIVVLASSIHMFCIPGALQVIATVSMSFALKRAKHSRAGLLGFSKGHGSHSTQEFPIAMRRHPMWGEPLPVCVCEFHAQGARRSRLVMAVATRVLLKAERALIWDWHIFRGGPPNQVLFLGLHLVTLTGLSSQTNLQGDKIPPLAPQDLMDVVLWWVPCFVVLFFCFLLLSGLCCCF